MSLVRLIIPGQYRDSQLYRGRLYLCERTGSILTLDWDRLVDSVTADSRLKLATTCAFRRSDYLYRVASTGIFHDDEFKALLAKRFDIMASSDIEVDKARIERSRLSHQENRFPFPHADSIIYARRLYIASRKGVFAANCSGKTKHEVSTRMDKLWDGSALSIGASYGSLALAAGDDGLWEYEIQSLFPSPRTGAKKNPLQLTPRHCSDCHWSFYSIFGSSSLGHGFLAAYKRHEEEAIQSIVQRAFDRLIDDGELFAMFDAPAEGYSWAAQDKMCQAVNGSVRVLKYQPWLEDQQLRPLGILSLDRGGSQIVSAKVALFGTVVELQDGLRVIPSTGSVMRLNGEPVCWRIFPRSRHYENQMHIIYDDRMEVLSFNHDYFVDQKSKVSGISARVGYDENVFDSLGLK